MNLASLEISNERTCPPKHSRFIRAELQPAERVRIRGAQEVRSRLSAHLSPFDSREHRSRLSGICGIRISSLEFDHRSFKSIGIVGCS
jgi:hypothetical protein